MDRNATQRGLDPRETDGRTVADRAGEPRRDALARYFGEVQRQDRLTADEEISIAREIEELEVGHWRALLGFSPAFDAILAAITPVLENLPVSVRDLRKHGRASATRRARALDEAARELRALDVERSALYAAHGAALELASRLPEASGYARDVTRARGAQERAKGRFVSANLRLVITMARKFDHGTMPLPDLIQEGNLGLMRAVERFDWRRGYRFSTYAGWWIRHGLTRALADKGRLVRVPVHTLDDAQRVARTTRMLVTKTGREPTLQELAAETGFSEEKLAFLRENAPSPTVSLDRPVGEESETTLLDLLASPTERTAEETVDASDWTERLDGLLSVLTPMEASILRSRFGIGDREERTLREIGEEYHLSRERIRQLQEQALAKLRVVLESGRAERDAA